MNSRILAAAGIAVIVAAGMIYFGIQTAPGQDPKIGLVINTPHPEVTLLELDKIYEKAASTGIGRSNVYMFWNLVEPEQDDYDWGQYDSLMGLNEKNNLKVTLYFSLINGKTLGPFPDWMGSPSLESIREEHLTRVLDAVLSRYDIIDYVVIAGDADSYFRYMEGNIQAYDELFGGVYAKIKSGHPDVKMGNSFSLNGVLNKDLRHIVGELSDGDFVAFTYMPVDVINEINTTPEEAIADLERALEISPDKNIAFFETSWATSDFVEGSEEDQRLFIAGLYDFYRQNEQDLEFLTWYRLYDRPVGTCAIPSGDAKDSGFGLVIDNKFAVERLDNYVCSAGLLNVNHGEKPGWSELTKHVRSLK